MIILKLFSGSSEIRVDIRESSLENQGHGNRTVLLIFTDDVDKRTAGFVGEMNLPVHRGEVMNL
ncbi:MAG: hypothetical protein JW915_01410 [Chitinispirillaceae bacterium]|nr:hypothetical protein [Chitinispirillaceae bacterium]